MERKNQPESSAVLLLEHTCYAPKEVVFDAFANAEALAEWWGPKDTPITVVRFDFKPGGIFLYKADAGEQTMWGRFVYEQIKRPDLIEFVNSFSNEKGEISRAPFSPVWPLEIFNQLRFEEQSGKTMLSLKGYPLNATAEEEAMFVMARQNVEGGFKATLQQLDKYLSRF